MRLKKELSGLFVRGYALEKGQNVAGLVGDTLVKQRWTKSRVDTDNLLQERGNGAH